MTSLPPWILYFVAALLLPVLPARARAVLLVLVPVLGGYLTWNLTQGSVVNYQLLQFDLTLIRADKLSLLFTYLFNLAAFIGFVYSFHLNDIRQQAAAVVYSGSALGAVLAGDLLTLFIFWELLALSSVFLIWARGTERAYHAGMRYLLMQVLSGVLLLGGVLAHYQQAGSLTFDYIGLQGLGGYLIFIAFGIKCAFPFFHSWLTDAYPEATPTGTVFLSALTTKVAVYALARGFPGTEALLYIGGAMTCFPIFFAVIENDLRRVLAYSMINQIGFMVVGVGIGTSLALNGTVAHAFNDVIFKGLLMMSMGAVLHRMGHVDGSNLGGLYKTMPKTTVFCIIGAASISAFPLFSGFVSKSMIVAASIKEGYVWLWLMLLFASAGVFHHAGIKIPFFAFFAHDSGQRPSEAPTNMLIAMSVAASLCLLIGCYPPVLYSLLPFGAEYWPYDFTHVLTQCQILFFSALAFVWLNLKGMYPPELRSVVLDFDWFYRVLANRWVRVIGSTVYSIDQAARTLCIRIIDQCLGLIQRNHGEDGLLSRTWPSGSMVLWVSVLLAAYLMLYYS